MNYERPPQAVTEKEENENAPLVTNAAEVVAEQPLGKETILGTVSPEEIAELKFSPEPGREIDVVADSASIRRQLEQVTQLLATEERELQSARKGLQESELEKKAEESRVKETEAPRLAQLKEVKAKLEEQNEQLGVADEWQSALDTLHALDTAELESLQKTGLRRNGERLRARRRALDPLEAMQLASLASQGVRRLTWGKFGELFAELMQVADTVLKDILSPFKRMLGSQS
jgi:hypothetical protein